MPAGILFLVIIGGTCCITARFNSYVISALIIYFFFSIIGAFDDIVKVLNKTRVMQGTKTKQDYQYKADGLSASLRLSLYLVISFGVALAAYKYIPNINGFITIPFLSVPTIYPYFNVWIFVPFMALAIAIMANGVNFTDGFDTLAVIPSITSLIFVGIIAYVSSHSLWSSYLLIPYIPHIDEILPIVGAMIGTLLAFLWFDSPRRRSLWGIPGQSASEGQSASYLYLSRQFFFFRLSDSFFYWNLFRLFFRWRHSKPHGNASFCARRFTIIFNS